MISSIISTQAEAAAVNEHYVSNVSVVRTKEGENSVYSILILLFEEGEYAGNDFIYDAARDEREAGMICSQLSGYGVTPATARDIIEDIIAGK